MELNGCGRVSGPEGLKEAGRLVNSDHGYILGIGRGPSYWLEIEFDELGG